MRLNPFRGLPNAKQVWAWGMYDLANQSFTLLIVTLFFSIYFQRTICANPDQGKILWGVAVGLSSAVVVILGPLWGALADFGGSKRAWLTATGLACSIITIALAMTGPGDVWLAFALFVLANIMFMGGENFLAAFLPEIATRDTMTRVSAIGWTMGYLGAMLVLPIAAVIVTLVGQGTLAFRIIFVFAGLWFLINTLPTLLILKERKAPERLPPGATLATVGFSRLAQSARHAPRYRQLVKFLIAFFLYSCGMSTIIAFSGELAYQHLGAGAIFLLFCWVLSLIAGIGSASTGFVQRRLGHKGVVIASLIVWILTSIGAAFLPPPGGPVWPIWLVGLGVGFGLGLTGNASRALVGIFTPAQKTAEFFALWGLAYKLSAVLGPPVYGLLVAGPGQGAAMLMVAAFFTLGLIVLTLVSVPDGRRIAEEDERTFASDIKPDDLAAAALLGPR